MAEDRQRAIEAGCDDYDTKPVEFKRLLGKISAMLENNTNTSRQGDAGDSGGDSGGGDD